MRFEPNIPPIKRRSKRAAASTDLSSPILWVRMIALRPNASSCAVSPAARSLASRIAISCSASVSSSFKQRDNQQIAVTAYNSQQVIEIVSYPTGQLSYGFHLVRLPVLFFQPPLFGHIASKTIDSLVARNEGLAFQDTERYEPSWLRSRNARAAGRASTVVVLTDPLVASDEPGQKPHPRCALVQPEVDPTSSSSGPFQELSPGWIDILDYAG